MSVFNTTVVAESDSGFGIALPASQGSKVVMLQGCGGWGRWRVGSMWWDMVLARARIFRTRAPCPELHPPGGLTPNRRTCMSIIRCVRWWVGIKETASQDGRLWGEIEVGPEPVRPRVQPFSPFSKSELSEQHASEVLNLGDGSRAQPSLLTPGFAVLESTPSFGCILLQS